MQSRAYSCPACLKSGLTETEFHSHLCQSYDPHCSALYQELMGFVPNDGLNNHNLVRNLDSPDELIPFGGDAFGGGVDYLDDNFGQATALTQQPNADGEDDNGHQIDCEEDTYGEQEDLLAVAQVVDLEAGWEPEHPGAQATSPSYGTITDKFSVPGSDVYDESSMVHQFQAEHQADASAFTI
jgi:hypothetical protein